MTTVVLKVGGAVAADAAGPALALAAQHDVCVVHGAGPQISAELERAGLESRFVEGRRVTSAAALAVVRRSLAAVNETVCAAIGPLAVPLFGDEIGLDAVRVPALGLVGEPVPCAPVAVTEALAAGLVPVVAPLGIGPLNVNADEAAAALAVGLGADRLLFVTDVPGLLLGGAVAAAIGDRRGRAPARLRDARRRHRPEAAGCGRRGARGRPRDDRLDGGGGVTTLAAAPLLPTYARHDVTFVSGEGVWLTDVDGRRYLDLLGGIAVVSLGHGHPAPLAAARRQLDALWHVSNLYSTEPMLHLAALLSDRFGGAQAFFCNSGTEAVEAALKWARKATGKPVVVALEGSFHGRTHGALAVTGQPAKREPWEPLAPVARFAQLNDVDSLAAATGPDTAAILIEPVQGEGGIHPAGAEFLAAARALADEHGALLVFDEVQCGVGRTGTFFAWEQAGVAPDALTLAKGLANGLPIGALLVADGAPDGFEPGDHGSTFGGNPVSCAAACAVVDALDESLLGAVRRNGEQLAAGVGALPGVVEVRGRGLMLGAELDRPAGPVVAACLEAGLLVGTAGEKVLRLTPPLTITGDELGAGLSLLEEVLR